jgi:hypothetical protein
MKMSLLGGTSTPGSLAGRTIGHASSMKRERRRERGKSHTTGRRRMICRQ